MKYFKLLTLLLFSAVVAFYGCKDETTATPEKADPQPLIFDNSSNTSNNTNTTAEPVMNTQSGYHYTCPSGCAGGAASAGNCATCGGELAHNSAYHNNTSTNNTQTADPIFNPTPPSPASSQTGPNAAGVYHYTCPSGCAGGAASAGNCGNCGGELAHNSAYHN